MIVLKSKGVKTGDVRAGKAGAPEFFDVLDHEVGSCEMIDSWGTFGIVHRVGHVSHERHIVAEVDLLPNGEWPAEHAHVEVDSAEHDVLNSSLLKNVPCLLTVVCERIAGEDFKGCDLTGPWRDDFTLLAGAGAAHIGIINGKRIFVFSIRPAPCGSPAFCGSEGNRSF